MTIYELIKKSGLMDIELIKMYAKNTQCEDCPLCGQCTAKGVSVQKCINYLTRELEIEK